METICIVCPIGCRLTIIKDDTIPAGYVVSGNQCKRGERYGILEMTNPTRVITSTIKINNAHLKRLPVKTNGAIPKDMNFKCMELINSLEVQAPVKVKQVIVKDILGTGIDLVASRSME
ncbi:DUF1667 domain-containing protein [Proteiniborus sp. MB09-C3]|uniref:DUF1667 domain-containing protein n=1 Tax=Proteiniborus sp. MB09-C3 TaxID=3050072 RepID=UPI002552B572|nr:DUF1667 domain-containing protein [Proteiniborus sp. MB09-C3]WIV12679.1 DUF1667 domain-containing protein [Proteiniborus sp. MB09-C3]